MGGVNCDDGTRLTSISGLGGGNSRRSTGTCPGGGVLGQDRMQMFGSLESPSSGGLGKNEACLQLGTLTLIYIVLPF